MSVSVTTDVFCDGCGQWIGCVQGRVRQATVEARRIARSQGWRCNRTGDFCPECVP